MTTADPTAPPGPQTTAPAIVVRPTLWQELNQSARVTVVSAPAGSGKTILLTSWIDQGNLAGSAAFVQVLREERDPQRFWLSVLTALRATSAGSRRVRELTPSPDLDDWAIVERVLADLAPLEDRLWLVIDDVHELRSEEARQQLELLVLRAPPQLRIILATRHDVRLGVHRLRLEGGLTEIRADDLRFTRAEARKLFQAGGLELTDSALAALYERTEGWAAGLRLAALSLAGHPDPARFAAEFSGTERTVTEYLLAEVLERQPADVRRLMLRTSVLERVNGQLADLLTGGIGGERALQVLESRNVFTVSLDTARYWFRYHHLFADLLQLELRNTEPEEIPALHELAAGWLAANGYAAEAIGHALAARNWALASSLVVEHWLGLYLDGRGATVHALMSAFPAGAANADAELAAAAAGDELAQGSLGPSGEGDNTITVFDRDGRLRNPRLVSDPELSPLDLAIGPGGNLVVSSEWPFGSPRARPTIREYDSSAGRLVRVLAPDPAVKFTRPRGLRFGPDGQLYCVGQDHVVAFDFPTGRFLGVIAELRRLNGQAVLLLK